MGDRLVRTSGLVSLSTGVGDDQVEYFCANCAGSGRARSAVRRSRRSPCHQADRRREALGRRLTAMTPTPVYLPSMSRGLLRHCQRSTSRTVWTDRQNCWLPARGAGGTVVTVDRKGRARVWGGARIHALGWTGIRSGAGHDAPRRTKTTPKLYCFSALTIYGGHTRLDRRRRRTTKPALPWRGHRRTRPNHTPRSLVAPAALPLSP